MRLPNKEFHQLVPKLREKGFYPSQEQRKIDWPTYNQNEIDNIIEVLDFINNIVDAIELPPINGKTGRPLTNPHSLAKAILLCEELHLDERNAQGWLNILGPRVGITENLDDRVIGDASTKPEVIYIVKTFDISGTQECQIMHELITQVKGKTLALDAGFVDRKLIEKIAEQLMTP